MTAVLHRVDDGASVALPPHPPSARPRVLHQPGSYHYAFDPRTPPIATIAPGERVIIHTADCFLGRLTSEDQIPSAVLAGQPLNPLSGPFWIEGAEPGDTLLVHIDAIQPAREWAVSCLLPGCGALDASPLLPAAQSPLPERVWRYTQTAHGGFAWRDRWEIPWAPMFGTIGTAPNGDPVASLDAGPHGGNLDVPDIGPGCTLHLPVQAPGALFSVGDAHAAQGQGELSGPALEIEAYGTLRFDLVKGRSIEAPRLETRDDIMTIGIGAAMDEAARLACAELTAWMAADHGFDWLEAYQLLTLIGGLHAGNMVNSTSTMVASCPKRFLPCGGGIGRSWTPHALASAAPVPLSPPRRVPPPGERPWHLT